MASIPQLPLPSPAVRHWLYRVLTALVPLLVVYGVLDANQVALWLSLAAAVLGTGTASVAVGQQRKSGTFTDTAPGT